jgi:(1->4)-alpha-D-glucan 1-alpha-D-glucosylmutase
LEHLSGGHPEVDRRTQYGLLQNLVGAWPISRGRFAAYATKAMREAKLHTSWEAPNEPYERAVSDWLERAYEDGPFRSELDGFVSSIADSGYQNSLCQKVLLSCCPGVPDLYQGTELWDFSLVDPDNRRPVDYEVRRQSLAELESTSVVALWRTRADGRIKLHVVHACLDLRSRRPESFSEQGNYAALDVHGDENRRCLAFTRGDDVAVVVARFWQRHGNDFGRATVTLPDGHWTNVLTRAVHPQKTGIPELLGPLPVAVLERTNSK